MKVALFGNIYKKEYISPIDEVLLALKGRNAEIVAEEKFFRFMKESGNQVQLIDGIFTGNNFEADLALSIGGDGTFLTTANAVNEKDIPILGINTGRLGFMADVLRGEINDAIEEIANGEYVIEKRSRIRLKTDNPKFREYPYALNEIAILKQDSASMISIRMDINGEYINTYQADGLIIATPTGSTAYNLSVGGPLVAPQANDLIISPVASHSLNIRPLVIPDTWKIDLEVQSRSKKYLVSLDGRCSVFDQSYKISIEKGEFSVKVLKRKNHTFFTALRQKLMWGMDKRKE